MLSSPDAYVEAITFDELDKAKLMQCVLRRRDDLYQPWTRYPTGVPLPVWKVAHRLGKYVARDYGPGVRVADAQLAIVHLFRQINFGALPPHPQVITAKGRTAGTLTVVLLPESPEPKPGPFIPIPGPEAGPVKL